MKVPKTLNWDLFLGPAPDRPYNSIYHPWNWRGWWDFGTGALGDMACHILAPVVMALKLKFSILGARELHTNLIPNLPPHAEIVHVYFPCQGKSCPR
jgi:hypothetical protein